MSAPVPAWYSKCPCQYSVCSSTWRTPCEPRRFPKSSTLSTNDQSVPCEHSEYPNVSTMKTPYLSSLSTPS